MKLLEKESLVTEPGEYTITARGILITIELLGDMSVSVSATSAKTPSANAHNGFLMDQLDADMVAYEWEYAQSFDSWGLPE